MSTPIMKCGCRANSSINGKPICAIHFGLTPDAEIVGEQPKLENRQAKCCYCKKTQPSNTDLPFFVSKPDQAQDEYYCGCRGWD